MRHNDFFVILVVVAMFFLLLLLLFFLFFLQWLCDSERCWNAWLDRWIRNCSHTQYTGKNAWPCQQCTLCTGSLKNSFATNNGIQHTAHNVELVLGFSISLRLLHVIVYFCFYSSCLFLYCRNGCAPFGWAVGAMVFVAHFIFSTIFTKWVCHIASSN